MGVGGHNHDTCASATSIVDEPHQCRVPLLLVPGHASASSIVQRLVLGSDKLIKSCRRKSYLRPCSSIIVIVTLHSYNVLDYKHRRSLTFGCSEYSRYSSVRSKSPGSFHDPVLSKRSNFSSNTDTFFSCRCLLSRLHSRLVKKSSSLYQGGIRRDTIE